MNSLQALLKKEATKFEKTNFATVNKDKWRLNFHLMPPVGWLNDPNGLCFFNNEYHVFFQYSPFEPSGGLKFWGHYKSKDLIKWEYMGVNLFPDQPFDCHGAYSGSAFCENDSMYIFYTGNIKYDGNYDYIKNGRGSNTIYAEYQSDGNVINKKCILTNNDYPSDLTCHVRDPKVWKDGDFYYMILGARQIDDKGVVLIYESQDRTNWKIINKISTSETFGYMWECPDLFEINNKMILSVSPQGITQKLREYQNIYQSGYFYLDGDYKSDYVLRDFNEWDMGFDFYAPQTFKDKNNRRIMYAWMGMPDCEEDYTNATIEKGWQHCLTIPREIVLKDEKIFQKPVKEMEKLRGKKIEIDNNCVISPLESYEILIDNINNTDCSIEIEKDLSLIYKNGIFAMKFSGNIGNGRDIRSSKIGALENVRIFVDTSSVEVFLNEGEQVFTTRFYPKDGKSSFKVISNGNVSLWEINKFTINYNI